MFYPCISWRYDSIENARAQRKWAMFLFLSMNIMNNNAEQVVLLVAGYAPAVKLSDTTLTVQLLHPGEGCPLNIHYVLI